MTGTIVNTAAIIAGSIVGAILHRGIKEKYKEVLYTGLGLASLGIGLNAFISNMPKNSYKLEKTGKDVSVLTITDPATFWSQTRYLVVQTK